MSSDSGSYDYNQPATSPSDGTSTGTTSQTPSAGSVNAAGLASGEVEELDLDDERWNGLILRFRVAG